MSLLTKIRCHPLPLLRLLRHSSYRYQFSSTSPQLKKKSGEEEESNTDTGAKDDHSHEDHHSEGEDTHHSDKRGILPWRRSYDLSRLYRDRIVPAEYDLLGRADTTQREIHKLQDPYLLYKANHPVLLTDWRPPVREGKPKPGEIESVEDPFEPYYDLSATPNLHKVEPAESPPSEATQAAEKTVARDSSVWAYSDRDQRTLSMMAQAIQEGDLPTVATCYRRLSVIPDVHVYEQLLQLCVKYKLVGDAVELMKDLQAYHVEPTVKVYHYLLQACVSCRHWRRSFVILNEMLATFSYSQEADVEAEEERSKLTIHTLAKVIAELLKAVGETQAWWVGSKLLYHFIQNPLLHLVESTPSSSSTPTEGTLPTTTEGIRFGTLVEAALVDHAGMSSESVQKLQKGIQTVPPPWAAIEF